MKVLVSNDDGIFSPGIHALAHAMMAVADEVVVVAPDVEQSASGHAITIRHPLRYRRTHLEELPDTICYRVDGTPADCVVLGVHNEGRPDVVVSGVNLGSNLGFDVTHSGTVAAAIEGTTMGIPSIAVSIRTGEGMLDFTHAAKYAAKLARSIVESGLPHRTLLNVNFPEGVPRGVVTSRLSTHSYKDSVVRREDPEGVPYYWVKGTPTGEQVAETDFTAVYEGFATVTPLSLDLTDHAMLKGLADVLPDLGA